jgi:hypothetical protein
MFNMMKIGQVLMQKDGLKNLIKENLPALVAQIKMHLETLQNQSENPILENEFVSVAFSQVDGSNIMIFLLMHQDDGSMRTGIVHNVNDLIDQLPSDLTKMLS